MEGLKELRKKIDQIDREILKWLKRRFEVTKKVGKLKFKENLPPRDLKREKELLKKKKRMGKKFSSLSFFG
jgi:monofunctional chorismate mutase